MKTAIRESLPSAITLAGLASGLSAALFVLHKSNVAACTCILIANLLDGLDGGLARRLNVATEFGLQLDSLSDMVTFGVAPSLLAFSYLSSLGVGSTLLWIVCIAYTVGGAFRLARFNLLPAKTSLHDSVGLTISVAGATLTLSILVNLTRGDSLLPPAFFPILMGILSALMVSRIGYPELGAVFRARRIVTAWLVALLVLGVLLSPQLAGLALVFPYVGFGPLRSAYRLAR